MGCCPVVPFQVKETMGLSLHTVQVAWPPGGTPGPMTTQRVRRSLPNLRRSSSWYPGLFQLWQPGSLTLDVNFPETNSGVFQGPSSPLPPVLSQSGPFGSLGLRGRVPHLAAHELLSTLDDGILINPAAPTLRPVSYDVR